MIPLRIGALLLGAATLLAGCAGNGANSTGGAQLSGSLDVTGSSTLYPIGQAWAEELQAGNPDLRIAYNVVGTGAGFKVFCRAESPLTGASRPIKEAERTDCAASGIEPYELQVAIDGLAVVVSTKNEFAESLTVEELNRIWTADASKQANFWDDLRPEWPHERIVLYGPGTDSGTFDYFVEVIIHKFDGTETKGRSDYTPSEDDNRLVQGVEASAYALGYFGLAYVHENSDKVRALAIDNGDGPVEPTAETVEAGKYAPLARPIFYYTDGKPEGIAQAFLEFGLSPDGQELVREVGYIAMPPQLLAQMQAKVSG